jgi:hypothetical protein
LAPGFTLGFATMAVSAAARTVEVVDVLVVGVVFRVAGSAAGLLLSFGAALALDACVITHASAPAQA